jgi:hypothetical protein
LNRLDSWEESQGRGEMGKEEKEAKKRYVVEEAVADDRIEDRSAVVVGQLGQEV